MYDAIKESRPTSCCLSPLKSTFPWWGVQCACSIMFNNDNDNDYDYADYRIHVEDNNGYNDDDDIESW